MMSKRSKRSIQKANRSELLVAMTYGLPSVIATFGLVALPPVRAENAALMHQPPDIDLATLSTPKQSSPQPATSVTEWQAQLEASIVEVTAVRVEPSAEGLKIILETATGQLSIPTPTTEGNRLSAVIPNAKLALLEGTNFVQDNSITGIAQISVIERTGDQVQVVITGTNAAPTATVNKNDQRLVFAVMAQEVAAEPSAEEELEVTVTAEKTQEGYFVPEASCKKSTT